MPRAPQVSAAKLIRVLKKLGFVEHVERGTSHLVLSHSDGRRTVIVRHPGNLPKGTLGAILRDLKISPDELRKLL